MFKSAEVIQGETDKQGPTGEYKSPGESGENVRGTFEKNNTYLSAVERVWLMFWCSQRCFLKILRLLTTRNPPRDNNQLLRLSFSFSFFFFPESFIDTEDPVTTWDLDHVTIMRARYQSWFQEGQQNTHSWRSLRLKVVHKTFIHGQAKKNWDHNWNHTIISCTLQHFDFWSHTHSSTFR